LIATTDDAIVGLVIVTYNAATYIERCLSAVAAQTRHPNRIILIDNASSDDPLVQARAAAARLGLTAIEIVANDRNLGFAAANNQAVKSLSDCSLVATLNPDAFPAPAWLAALLDAARRHPEAASFASRTMMHGDPERLDGSGDVYHITGLAWRRSNSQRAEAADLAAADVFSACAAAALYRRSDWVAVGGFDESYFCYAEDVDLGFRLRLLGRGCRYVPEAVASHGGSASAGVECAFAVYHGHRNLEWTYVKNMPSPLFLRHLPRHLIGSLAVVGWYIARGRGASILKAKWDALRGLPAAWRLRRQIQAQRRATPESINAVIDRTPLSVRFRARAERHRA
jgi:GT2 family glycosyltransferase